jgi:hypothetical protein
LKKEKGRGKSTYCAVQLEALTSSEGKYQEEELLALSELLKYPSCARLKELEVAANSYEGIPLLHAFHDRLARAHVHACCDACCL